jgi:nicotinamide/nicotinate riboside kinase
VSDSVIESLKASIDSSIPSDHPLRSGALSLCLLDGFLLYPSSMSPIHPYIDIKLFLRTTYDKAKMRRERRDGYVTIEGFWSDPPGYVDKIVWPNYVKEHTWMFKDGNVEGEFNETILEKEGIRTEKGVDADRDLESTLRWAADILLDELRKEETKHQ